MLYHLCVVEQWISVVPKNHILEEAIMKEFKLFGKGLRNASFKLRTCFRCGGTGRFDSGETCYYCQGSGVVDE